MDNQEELKPVEVFAGNSWDAGLVKSMLEDAEIESFLQDEVRGTLTPFLVGSGGFGAVKLVVSSDDYEKAKQVVDGYYQNINKA